MNVIGYVRVSSEDQARKGVSLDAQEHGFGPTVTATRNSKQKERRRYYGCDYHAKHGRHVCPNAVLVRQNALNQVGKITDSTVELNGRYEITNPVGLGQPIRYPLSREGDRLRGYDGMRSPWLFLRIR